MRVVFLQDHLRNGGTENQTIHLADQLAKIGIETHLVVFRQGGILDAKATGSKAKVHFLKQGPLKTDWFAPGLHRCITTIQPDIIVAMGRMANCHAGLVARRSRDYRLVSTFRTGKRIPRLYRRALLHSDHIVANSHEAVQRLRDQHNIHRPSNTTVIYNGCLLPPSSPSSSSSSSSSPSSSQPPHPSSSTIHLVSVSMFRPEKKQIRLLRFCSQLKTTRPWHLTLAGDGSERQPCQAEAARLGIADKVSFPGLVADPTLLYKEGHVAVHASDSESLPNFLIEAQMAGLPVISYDTGGARETFIDHQSGFLIPHGDENRFVEKLDQLIDNAERRQQMSDAAREHAKANFTPEIQTHAYQALFAELT